MASITKDIEFENVMFDIPVSSDGVSFSKSADTIIQEPSSNSHENDIDRSIPKFPHFNTTPEPHIESLQIQTNTTTRNSTWPTKLMSTFTPSKNYNPNNLMICL